jgi:branched-subunit amino acid aminotransferase/4-amino-4-deoxychorismate lyase
LTPEDAFSARELFVGNSLRGLVPARLDAKMRA